MSRLQNEWQVAAEDLGLDIIAPYELKTETFSITAEVLLKNFGGPQGILIVSNYDIIEPFRNQISELGYGYSTLTEPDRELPFTGEEKEAFIEMLSEWGWCGPGEAPYWLVALPEESTEE